MKNRSKLFLRLLGGFKREAQHVLMIGEKLGADF
jgi:hypothetical protein